MRTRLARLLHRIAFILEPPSTTLNFSLPRRIDVDYADLGDLHDLRIPHKGGCQ